MILAALVATRFLHYAALIVAVGAALSLRGLSSSDPRGHVPLNWGRRVLLASAGVTLLTSLLLLGATAANLAGDFRGAWDVEMLTTILDETDFGAVWAARMSAAVLLAGIAWLALTRVRRALFEVAAAILALGLIASLALTGHPAATSGAEGWVHRLADAGHLIAAALWLGALPPLLFLLRLARAEDEGSAALAAKRLTAFHTVGLASVLVLAATGLVNSWFLVDSPANLLTTPYGLLLTTKLIMFGLMVGLAANNRLALVPALTSAVGDAQRTRLAVKRVRTSVRLEWLLGIALLAVVAVLGAIEPAGAETMG